MTVFGSFWLGNSVDGNKVQLHPGYNMQDTPVVDTNQQRGVAGGFSSYKLAGGYFDTRLPLFVSSMDASVLRGWWKNQTDLWFAIEGGGIRETQACKITNINEPFPTRAQTPDDPNWQGNLYLKSTEDLYSPSENRLIRHTETIVNTPLILDDPVYGLVDGFVVNQEE